MAYSDKQGTPVNIENKDKLRNSADLLPMYFRTEANRKFFGATVDSLISKGNLDRLNGFVGARNTENASPKDVYISEPTANRRRYNFLPSAVTKNPVDNSNKWTGTYDDLINQLDFFGGITDNHDKLFQAEYFAWNPMFDFDKFVNYRQYYWLSQGPDPVSVSGNPGNTESEYSVTNSGQNSFVFTPNGFSENPTVVLYRGGTYKFKVNATGHPFYIKTANTIGIGDQYNDGVENNGAESGTITFTVPVNAPDRLFYACQYHQSMQGTLEIRDTSQDLTIDVEQEIIGKANFTSANGVKLTNGMKINFVGDVLPTKYREKNWYVEGVGDRITLIDETELDTPELYAKNAEYEFDVDPFDDTPYDDTENSPLTAEYITINRASKDKNPWSRYNRWVHKDVIELSAEYNNTSPVLDENNRAVRPILEFNPNLKLFNFGEKGIGNVDLIDTDTKDAMSDVEGSFGYHVDEVLLRKGMRVIFNADPDITVKGKVYEVDFVEYEGQERLHLIEKYTPLVNDSVVATDGAVNQGVSYYYNGTEWVKAQVKTELNQSPLFDLFDSSANSFSNATNYFSSNFQGNAIASYKRGVGANDPVLGFPISYQNINNVGDITFEFNWDDSEFTYQENNILTTVDTASGLVYDYNDEKYYSGWQLVKDKVTRQRILQVFDLAQTADTVAVNCIKEPYKYDLDIIAEYNGVTYKETTDFEKIIDKNRASYQLKFKTPIEGGTRVTLKVLTDQKPNDNGFYEPPINLTNNGENNDLRTFTLGSVSDHFKTIFQSNTNIIGKSVGPNNARDVYNIHLDGSRYVKHKGSVLPAILFLIQEDLNFVNSMRKTGRDYNFFKDQFIEKAGKIERSENIASDVDKILYELSINKSSEAPYFYSDMAGFGKKVERLQFEVKNGTQNVFAINNAFDTTKVSDRAVYVYLNDVQLYLDTDYEFDAVDNTVTIKKTLSVGDIIKVNDYDTTGSVIPHTPTKLGLYPAFVPEIFVDNSYLTATKVIQGHDGSITKAFDDERDELILELEKRIYNNLKVKYNRDVFDILKQVPGKYRTNTFTANEFNKVLRTDFGYWKSLFDIDYETNNVTVDANPFSYNFNTMISVDDQRLPGYWRAIYKSYFDTDRPHTHPWEMLGITIKPTWWDEVYGQAPYTSGNKILWDDIERGLVRDPSGNKIYSDFARLGLSKNLPVDEYGDLIDPSKINIVKAIFVTEIKNDWKYGDEGPAETSWRKSSWYPFALQNAVALTKPAQYFGSQFDTNQNQITASGNVVYADTGKIFNLKEAKIKDLLFSNKRFLGLGYHVPMVEYLKSFSKDVKETFYDTLRNTSSNLTYKLGGFANKNRLRVLAESSNPNTADNSVFLPSENYQLTLRKSNPINSVRISGMIVEKTTKGFLIRGYDTLRPWFNIYKPKHGQNDIGINVGGTEAKFVIWSSEKFYGEKQIVEFGGKYFRVKTNHTSTETFDNDKFTSLGELPITGGAEVAKARSFENKVTEVSYGTVYARAQEVYDVILGYEHWLKEQGFVFDKYQRETLSIQDWDLSAKEFLYWTTQNWAEGSVIALSPFANNLEFEYKYATVDSVLNSFYEYSILSANGAPLEKESLSIVRGNGKFLLSTKGTQKGIFFAVLNLVQWEHIVVFDDKSQFGDVIYDQEAGYRQKRIKLVGFKTSEWDGDYVSPGFVFDEAVVEDYVQGRDYNLGDVVRFKSKYYSASKFLPATKTFNFSDWVFIGDKPVAELLPNLDYKASSYEDFYALESENFDQQTTELSQHLLGYQKRLYLDNLIRDDIAQYKFYTGFIKEKGTENALQKLNRLTIDGTSTDLSINENWALKIGSLGSGATTKEIELVLSEANNVENPQAYEFVNAKTPDADTNTLQLLSNELTLKPNGFDNNPWKNFDTSDEGVSLNTIQKIPTAGYARIEDVNHTVFNRRDILTDTTIPTLGEGASVWVAKDDNDTWNIYRLTANNARVIQTETDLVVIDDGLLELATDIPHGLKEGDTIVIRWFDSQVNGTHIVAEVNGLRKFKVATELTTITLAEDSATGTILNLESVRVNTPNEINNIKDIAEFSIGSKIWADDTGNGEWKVYEKTKAFVENQFTKIASDAKTYASSIAFGNQGRTIVVGNPGQTYEGSVLVLRRKLNSEIDTLEGASGFNIGPTFSDRWVGVNNNAGLGHSVSLSSTTNTLVAGAPFASSVRTETDPERPNFKYSANGATVSSFTKQGVVKLTTYNSLTNVYDNTYVIGSPKPANNEEFGYSVATSDQRVVVGAPGRATNTGAVYVYEKGTDWDYAEELLAPEYTEGDRFGEVLVATKDLGILIVSAKSKETIAEAGDSTVKNTGKVFVYYHDGTGYNLIQTIDETVVTSLGNNDLFGSSMGISNNGDTLVIGAPLGDVTEVNQGTVYVFERQTQGDSTVGYALKETIISPSIQNGEQFGHKIAVNPDGTSFAVSSASGSNDKTTTFDNKTTTFDAYSTNFIDNVTGTGSVYTFTKLGSDFVFGQKLSSNDLQTNDGFGSGLAYSTTSLYVGAPYFELEDSKTGMLFVYQKEATAGWNTLRQQGSLTDPFSIEKVLTYRTDTQTIVDFLEPYDPVKGKIPYIAETELTYKSERDPAIYTTSDQPLNVDPDTNWGATHVGETWWDLSTVRYTWYEQGDIEFRKNNWGTTFPGSRIDIYEWVESDISPEEWNNIADTTEGIAAGFSGATKYDDNTYVLKRVYDTATNNFVDRYYFWVRNAVILPQRFTTQIAVGLSEQIAIDTRKLPANEIASVILDPKNYGIKSIQLLDTNAFSVTNVKTSLSDLNVSLNIQYKTVKTDIPDHNSWLLLDEKQRDKIDNQILIKKLYDSLVGFDNSGNSVPDAQLPVQKKYGLAIRPRQSIFVDRLKALEVLITYTNNLLAKYRVVDEKDLSGLSASDPKPTLISGKYDVEVAEFSDINDIKTQDLKQATAEAVIVNGRVKSVNVINKGFGYTNAPDIEISGEGYGAKFKSTINADGEVTGIEVLKEGRNYTTGTIRIRAYKVLVTNDETAGNYWTMYEWNSASEQWSRTNTQTYDVTRFWNYKDYVVEGFDVDSIIDFKIAEPYLLKTIEPNVGELVEVTNVGDGNKIILRKVESNGTWNADYDIMYKAKSTIEFSTNIYDYSGLSFGFAGAENFDINLYDEQPTQETRIILENINNNIFVDDLKFAWNEFLFTAIRYAISEQTFTDWIFKTSLISVKNNLGGFTRKVNYNLDDPGDVEKYVKEIKPYSVTIKDMITSYQNREQSNIFGTDFDLPSRYNEETKKFEVLDETSELITSEPFNQWFENYKFSIDRIDIASAGSGYTQAPIVVISGGREDKPAITQTKPFRSIVTTDYDNQYVYINTTSVPDHFYNTTNVVAQNLVYQIPRFPSVPEVKVPTPLGAIGVAVNGVSIFNPSSAATERLGGVEYTVNAVYSHEELGIDDGSGHPQEDGIYHYHSDPKFMYNKDSEVHSPILGYAFDGFPIYGPYGYRATNDKTIVLVKSSYRLKTTPRADGSMPTGRYNEDYEYVEGLGDLDENNGRFVQTPEHPQGTYAYFIAVEADAEGELKEAYPYIVGPNYHGTPLLPNGNGTMPQSGNINATATAYISRNKLGKIVVNNPGAGYVSAPTVTITGGGDATEIAKAVAILENNKVRTSKTSLKFDRTSSKALIESQDYIDTYTSTSGQVRYKLTYVPTLDKRDFTISVNNETVFIENFDVSIQTLTDNTYKKQVGYVILKTLPKERSTVQITYKKNVGLMNAVDRINYFYNPTDGMPGKELSQLMTGIEYDGVKVQGLDFGVSVGWDGLPWFSHGWDTFSGDNTDYAFRADGNTNTFTLPYAPDNGDKLNVYFDGQRQDPTNTPTIVGDGDETEYTLNVTPAEGVLVVFRQEDSDGSTVPTDVNNLDTLISGGNFAYSTATGAKPEDISLDGDGFVTPDTSHAPEEVVPGQVFDALSMKVYNAPADGSPIIDITRHWGDGNETEFSFNKYPGTEDSILVTVGPSAPATKTSAYKVLDTDYTVDYANKKIILTTAPATDELVTITTLNVAGTNMLEKQEYVDQGDSTIEFILTSKYEDVKSAFVTVNGVVQEYEIYEDTDSGSAKIVLTNPPNDMSDAVTQITALSGLEKTFSQVKTDVFNIASNSGNEFYLSQVPDKIEPFHAMVVVELDGKRLRAPDTIYYVANGITLDYLVSQDPAYPAFSLALGELEVHRNGVRLEPIADYQFNTATNLITFYEGKLSSGDVIAITVLRNHDYEIRKNTTDDSTNAGYIRIINNSADDSTGLAEGQVLKVTSFTNHDANLMRKEVYAGNPGGTYTLSRKSVDVAYIWVELNNTPLIADADYKILDNGTTVYIDNRFSQKSTDRVVITSFSEDKNYDGVGFNVFQDMLNRNFYKRISKQDTTILTTKLLPGDKEIEVQDTSFFDTPSAEKRIPGVVIIGKERIEFYEIEGNKLKQITRGTLGTGIADEHLVNTQVFDFGPTQTMPYKDSVSVYEIIVRDGLPNGKSVHVLETINIASGANAHNQVEVYVGGRKLQKPTSSTNPITKHDASIAYDSNETNSTGVASDVVQEAEFTIEPVADSTAKGYYKLILRDEPENGTEIKVVQKQGHIWYTAGSSTASNGVTLQRAETPQATFLLERSSGLPVINIKE